MIKFTQSLNDYRYILSFDLAKKVSGYSLVDYKDKKVITVGTIDMTKGNHECVWADYAKEIKQAIENCMNALPEDQRSLVFITKEKLPTQSGRFSSIDTLQALAQCHAICDAVVYNSGVPYYDFEGIHAVSVKAYFKRITGLEKPTKEDIQRSVAEIFNFDFSSYTLDVSDSVAVAVTLFNSKYNKDLTDQIKELKKQIKTYKSSSRAKEVQAEVQRLQNMIYDMAQ